MKDNNTRLVYFDMLKLFAIFLVIVGHCAQYLLSSSPYDEPLYVYIYSFHMPLFMIISGFFSFKKDLKPEACWGGKKTLLSANNTIFIMDDNTWNHVLLYIQRLFVIIH